MPMWPKGKIVKLKKIKPISDDRKATYLSSYCKVGYFSMEVEISIFKDNALLFFDNYKENQIYFYPEQVKHLKKILNSIKSTKGGSEGHPPKEV